MPHLYIMTAFPKAPSFHRIVICGAVTILLSLFTGWFQCVSAFAESSSHAALHTTFVIFADRRMPDEEWTDLSVALRRAQASIAATTPALSGEMEIVRGDQIRPGQSITTLITIFLRGDCTLVPRPRFVVQGALAWVPRSKGFIGPFVTVYCSRLVDMLGPLALGMDRSRRNAVMAEAMARVILHEWIHIATQSAGHGAHGVTQSVFGVRDLLADDPEAQRGLLHKRI